MKLNNWKYVFMICSICLFLLEVIVLVFFVNSPHNALFKSVDEFLEVCRQIAKFNGLLIIK